jgi:hypothetical protein
MQRVEKLEKENEENVKKYREVQRKLNDVQRRLENSPANVILLAGLRKDSVKIQSNINILQRKIKKLNTTKQNEQTKNSQLLDYYKAQVLVKP